MKLPNDVQMGTLGGTLCSLLISLSVGDMLRTALLAAIGAIVSFAVSKLLDRWVNRR